MNNERVRAFFFWRAEAAQGRVLRAGHCRVRQAFRSRTGGSGLGQICQGFCVPCDRPWKPSLLSPRPGSAGKRPCTQPSIYSFLTKPDGTELTATEANQFRWPKNPSLAPWSFRLYAVELALDHELDPVLRQEMEHRLESLRVNPLEGSPGNEVRTAGATTLRFRSRPRNMDILRSGLTTCAPRSSHSVRQPNI